MLEGWAESRIDELGNGRRPVLKAGPFGSAVTKATYEASGYKVYGQQEVVAKDLDAEAYFVSEATFRRHKSCAVEPGDILMTMMGTIGRVYRVPHGAPKGIINPRLVRIAFDRSRILPEFAEAALEQPPLQRLLDRRSHGGTMQGLNLDALASIRLSVPPLPEQRKIAEILRTWDEALEKLTALRATKVRRISSLRQRLFEAEYASHNRLQRARDLFETVSERARPDLPLLAVMQDIGIVRRDELDRRVAMPDGDTSTYKVVRPGDFVISLRSFEGGLEYSSIIGLVSPAYTVLRPTTDLIGDYYRHFFKSRSFIGRLDKLIFGIRDGKQIAFRDFGDMYIPAPPVAEQEAHALALGSLEADLALEDERIAALTRQKRGLMQKLLTGEWRVKLEAPVA
ncbi:MAG: restriction endonuclease subunit S [Pikeienuella sp.]|uniref:restriction endonuclease subunit S n=1 Tax=Pikeienuella sp. TaxID=2831957 RepID=UPI00391BA691